MNKDGKGEKPTWPSDDGCHDYWETIVEIIQRRKACVAVKWMPSHLDEPQKEQANQVFIEQGGTEAWILGNSGADEMAKKGAHLAAPPEHLLLREGFARTLAKTVQKMSVHIWAAEKGITEVGVVEADECALDDLGMIESGDGIDPYIDAFNDLLSATEPEAF